MESYILKFTPESMQDIVEAFDYYESKKNGLGKRFKAEIKLKLSLIKKSPLTYAMRYNLVRIALTDIFPYSIHFKVDESLKIVNILSILNQSRNPDDFWIK